MSKPATSATSKEVALTYVDTSVWCALYFNEIESDAVEKWLTTHGRERLVTTRWALAEFASAAAIRVRDKSASQTVTAQAFAQMERAFTALTLSVIESVDFEEAAKLCQIPTTKLRAGEALHVAVARRMGCEVFATLDNRLNDAAAKLGLRVMSFA